MQILILGGGVFVGASVLDAALAGGHIVTVFNRGRSRSRWPDGVEVLIGDRGADLARLDARRFDAVIDTCGYLPAELRTSVDALVHIGRYLFVSSVSAYASFRVAPLRETAALADAGGIDPADRDPAHYGAQKAACEAIVRQAFVARATIVRPGLIVGPRDPTGRFSHWPWRSAAGGRMLVPAMPVPTRLQCIDVRDLATWMVRLVEHDLPGEFNANGPVDTDGYGWAELIDGCAREVAARGGTPAQPVRVAEAFLLEQGVAPWSELPLWLPSTDPDYAGFMAIDVERARRAGLHTRPLRETVRGVLDEPAPAEGERRAGKLTRSREAELLASWDAGTPARPGAGSE